MKKITSLMFLSVFALSVLTACQSASTANSTANNTNKANQPKAAQPKTDEHGHTDDAPRITLAEAKKDFDAGNTVFIDTRAAASYNAEHIKGAINLPMEAVEARYKEIPTGKKIIAYCS